MEFMTKTATGFTQVRLQKEYRLAQSRSKGGKRAANARWLKEKQTKDADAMPDGMRNQSEGNASTSTSSSLNTTPPSAPPRGQEEIAASLPESITPPGNGEAPPPEADAAAEGDFDLEAYLAKAVEEDTYPRRRR